MLTVSRLRIPSIIALSLSFVFNAQGASPSGAGAYSKAAAEQVISDFKKMSSVREFSESGPDAVVDNDGDAEEFQERYGQPLSAYVNFLGNAGLLTDPNLRDVYYKNTSFMSFEKVTAELTECMENEFDMIILANTAASGSGIGSFPAAQRIKYVRRATPGSGVRLFTRNERLGNTLMDFNTEAIKNGELITQEEMVPRVHEKYGAEIVRKSFDQTGAILTSSGKGGGGGILTYSGMFRLNPNKAESSPGMIHIMYTDYKYVNNSGGIVRDSGVAIHGTPKIQNLGRRDSHGCLRIHPDLALVWRNFVYKSDTFKSDAVLNLNKTASLPTDNVKTCQSGHSPGYKVLLVMFDGYSSKAL